MMTERNFSGLDLPLDLLGFSKSSKFSEALSSKFRMTKLKDVTQQGISRVTRCCTWTRV